MNEQRMFSIMYDDCGYPEPELHPLTIEEPTFEGCVRSARDHAKVNHPDTSFDEVAYMYIIFESDHDPETGEDELITHCRLIEYTDQDYAQVK